MGQKMIWYDLNDTEVVKTLEKWGEELKVTTKDLSEIGKTFGEKYEASIWDMSKCHSELVSESYQ